MKNSNREIGLACPLIQLRGCLHETQNEILFHREESSSYITFHYW